MCIVVVIAVVVSAVEAIGVTGAAAVVDGTAVPAGTERETATGTGTGAAVVEVGVIEQTGNLHVNDMTLFHSVCFV